MALWLNKKGNVSDNMRHKTSILTAHGQIQVGKLGEDGSVEADNILFGIDLAEHLSTLFTGGMETLLDPLWT